MLFLNKLVPSNKLKIAVVSQISNENLKFMQGQENKVDTKRLQRNLEFELIALHWFEIARKEFTY